jgi:hypothetical protein
MDAGPDEFRWERMCSEDLCVDCGRCQEREEVKVNGFQELARQQPREEYTPDPWRDQSSFRPNNAKDSAFEPSIPSPEGTAPIGRQWDPPRLDTSLFECISFWWIGVS